MAQFQIDVSDEQREVIERASHEIHAARPVRSIRSGESARGSLATPVYDTSLDHWHPLLHTMSNAAKTLPVPTQLGPFDTGNIIFDGDVPVGGNSQTRHGFGPAVGDMITLTMHQDD
jgi:hypothetical protein